ncbi:MAG: hypothetical protein KAU21_00345, partial [Gammaproteobacteria bacterium]|nr:hypothetical protein [Gammaproteobacteria bacterium]
LEKENWKDSFSKANKALDAAKELYQSQIVPMMDRDDPEEDIAARILIKKFEYQILQSRIAALYPEQRIDFLVNVRDTVPSINEKSERELTQLIKVQKTLIKRAIKTAADYANKKDDISKKINELNVIAEKGLVSKRHVSEQFRKDKYNIDYAIFGDEAVNLTKSLAEITEYQKKINAKFDELYRSYTKILADQRIEYFIIIGRATWCEGEYCGNGTTKHYPPVMVDEKMFEYFDGLKTDVIAKMSTSWGREKFTINISNAAWNALRIDKRWNGSRGDDYAEYWVERTYASTYHRYIEVVNDRMTKGQWVRVKEDDFWKQYSNLGMAILTKPYGYYEEDALKDAQPVGMATIAKPEL